MRRLCTRLLFLLLASGLVRGASAQTDTGPLPHAEQLAQIRFNHLVPEDGLSQQLVHAILQDRNGFMWFGTNNGLNRYDGHDVTVFRHDPDDSTSLSPEWIFSLLEDRAGRLWMSTDRGIARFDPDAPDDEAWKTFDIDDGLPMLEFEPGRYHQGYTGELFFASAGGGNAIRPGDIPDNPHPPQMALTALHLFDQPVEPGPESPLKAPLTQTQAITLAHDQNDVTLEYVGLHFRNPAKNQYAYLLDGYDPDWREVGGLRQATYTGLPPGAYTFRVRGANADGVWNEEGIALKITILPPWWRTWWAYLMYGLLFAGGVFAVDRVQRRRLIAKEREKMRERELEQAKEIEKAYQDLRETKDRLVQQEKMASLGQLTAGIAHEIKNPLNFVNNFAEINEELADEMREAYEANPDIRLADLLDVLTDLKQNARVIAHHGKRADGIVHAMIQHASGGKGQREQTDVNQLVSEHIDLAYHGKRAQVPGLTVAIKRVLDAEAGAVEVVSQKIGRVVLNLLGNAFDAVHAHAARVNGQYAPTVTVTTHRQNGQIEIRVRDNGPGIPSEIREKIFEPFFTTKPTGQGSTGLGLSLSYDIVTQGHGGTLTVESRESHGATFIVTLPVNQTEPDSSA